jgi:hypothetical protein
MIWGSVIVTMQANGIVRTIIIVKHLGGEVRKPQLLLCYNYHNDIINEEDVIFATEP